MAILWWLVPTAVVAVVAMAWAAWAGREKPPMRERSDAAQERARQRMGEALRRESPTAALRRPHPDEPSTGVVRRRSA